MVYGGKPAGPGLSGVLPHPSGDILPVPEVRWVSGLVQPSSGFNIPSLRHQFRGVVPNLLPSCQTGPGDAPQIPVISGTVYFSLNLQLLLRPCPVVTHHLSVICTPNRSYFSPLHQSHAFPFKDLALTSLCFSFLICVLF